MQCQLAVEMREQRPLVGLDCPAHWAVQDAGIGAAHNELPGVLGAVEQSPKQVRQRLAAVPGLRPDLATSSARRFCTACQSSSETIRRSSNNVDFNAPSGNTLGVVLIARPLGFGHPIGPETAIARIHGTLSHERMGPHAGERFGRAGALGSSFSRRVISSEGQPVDGKPFEDLNDPLLGLRIDNDPAPWSPALFVNSPATSSPVKPRGSDVQTMRRMNRPSWAARTRAPYIRTTASSKAANN